MADDRLGVINYILLLVLFIPYLLIDLFTIATELTEDERMGG